MRNLFILRGAPASGKSTWIKENNLESYTISADNIRLMYQSPITNIDGSLSISQNNDTAVWKLLMELLERRMERGEFIIIDATHYKSSLISRYKDLVSKYRYRVNVVDFSNIEEEELIVRNAQRGFRAVPEEVIRKMVVALKDDSEVKKAYKVVTPQEAVNIIESPLIPFDANDYDKIVIFGDIHGCYDPLKEYFDANPFSEKTNYIFCGDYLDRGTQNKEVLEFLIDLKDKKNCVFIEGNHEKWLRIYSQKDYDINHYENRPVRYKDPYVTKIISQLKERKSYLEKIIKQNNMISEDLSKLLREIWEINPEQMDVFYRFEKVNVPSKQKELHKQIKEAEENLKSIETAIIRLQHEEYSTYSNIETLSEWYEPTFKSALSMDITNILEKNFNVVANRKDNPIKSLEFIKRTYPQIQEVDAAEIRRFCERLAQMSYISYNGFNYFINHGGLPCLPTIKTPTIEMIKGVGKYEDHEQVDKQFVGELTYQIHGHRNTMRTPLKFGKVFNLEGQVEFGGHLRIVEITKNGSRNDYKFIEIKNNNFITEELETKEEKTDLELLKEMYDSKWVQVKNLQDNIISLNFTRDAFEKDKWNNITTKARGLFVDKTNGNIVARSFDKFFNYHQHETTEPGYMKQNIKWPLIGYKKENGFLGIVSKHKGKVRFFTKSTDQGDFVNWFIGCLCDHYNILDIYSMCDKFEQTSANKRYSEIYSDILNLSKIISTYKENRKFEQPNDIDWDYVKELEASIAEKQNILNNVKNSLVEKLFPLLEEGYSYVFECIDKDNDPHIIKYDKNKIVLLEVFKNQLKEEHLNWFELGNVEKKLGIPLKFKELEFNNWEEFEEWKDKFRQGVTQWECKHEGYVFEDQNGYRVKFKSSFYNFWKQMRALKDILAGGRTNKKVYKTKEEIQVVKLMEELGRDKLKQMSIIDIEDMFYERCGE